MLPRSTSGAIDGGHSSREAGMGEELRALQLDNQLLRLRVRELEAANSEMQSLLSASGGVAGTALQRPSTAGSLPPALPVCGSGLPNDCVAGISQAEPLPTRVCPSCDREVPLLNFEAHTVHCQRHFRRCPACQEAMPSKDLANHLAQWADPAILSSAAEEGDLPSLRAARAHGTSFATFRTEGSYETLLHVAVRKSNLELLALLLGSPAQHIDGGRAEWLAAMDVSGQAVLHAAVASGQEALVAFLLEAGADANQRAASGDTPLLAACRVGHTSIAQRLVAAGADPEARTALGDTILQVAQSHGHMECALALGVRRLQKDHSGALSPSGSPLAAVPTPLRGVSGGLAMRSTRSFGGVGSS